MSEANMGHANRGKANFRYTRRGFLATAAAAAGAAVLPFASSRAAAK